ncbi:MAG: F0F1 ATP synthase subunit B [Thiotrichales bacterium]|jgi:F-type H+-transporting ATPase subunit b|nr:F0F1 ATP synthase subunit B [Thiotrichales bacterium]MBT3614086.1 F0F1 ATP synthase subunit B [Thiotrichales bacterium]MBT3752580.1 F0F1 ATP synthase subunit B [Thiotrichales bacterium]MBT3837227.1 F0F1 ATP synthase subunit B [Thiotrichales bacterium]MBT4151604.1 F0F1 ATP synthase subunit B [Thiotrichales bacterium]
MNINATLIGQSIAFFLFVLFVMKFVWPPLMAALDERKKQIVDGLAAAERGHHEHELSEKRATAVIKEAHEEASAIIGRAQQRANEVVEESKGKAVEESERIIETAHSTIEQDTNTAREKLRAEVSLLALAGASQILEREVNETDHQQILATLSAKL